jgi:hypothetical protein
MSKSENLPFRGKAYDGAPSPTAPTLLLSPADEP